MKQDVDALAAQIGEEYRKAGASVIESAKHYLACGRMLTEKKDDVGHGKWERWLVDNEQVLGFKVRAARMMAAAFKSAASCRFDEVTEAITFLRQLWGHDNHRAKGTGDNEWFTPSEWIARARAVLGTIDLDPASCDKAQTIVRAQKFFTKQQNGLKQKWWGKVWLNPPYTQPDIEQFALKAVAEKRSGNIEAALVLTHNYTDTAWFQVLAGAAAYIAFPKGRIRFVDPDGEECSPTQGQVIFCLCDNSDLPQRFINEFSQEGVVLHAR